MLCDNYVKRYKNRFCRALAARLRLAVFLTMGAMVVLYVAARLGLQFGHARIIYQEHGPGTLASHLIR